MGRQIPYLQMSLHSPSAFAKHVIIWYQVSLCSLGISSVLSQPTAAYWSLEEGAGGLERSLDAVQVVLSNS